MAEPRLGVDHIEGLPVPDVVNWPIFPFEGDLRVRTVRPFRDSERPRSGEPDGPPCHCSGEPDAYRPPAPIWHNDTWLVRPIRFGDDASPFPAYMLETVEHLDLDDFDDELGAELGVMTVKLERAIRGLGSVGRVHLNRWGDGGSHFHVWFLGRPQGAAQFSGFTLPFWGFTLPPLAEEIQGDSDLVCVWNLDGHSTGGFRNGRSQQTA